MSEVKPDLQFNELPEEELKIKNLENEILNLGKHLGKLLVSKLKKSQSYRYTASNLKELIQQKRKEITKLQNFSSKGIS